MSYHGRIMSLLMKDISGNPEIVRLGYCDGHRDARHAAAGIANEADTRIAELEAQVNGLTQALLCRDSAITAAMEQREAAEAQLAEANTRIQRLEILGAQFASELGAESMEQLNQAAGRAVDIQTRLETAEAREVELRGVVKSILAKIEQAVLVKGCAKTAAEYFRVYLYLPLDLEIADFCALQDALQPAPEDTNGQ